MSPKFPRIILIFLIVAIVTSCDQLNQEDAESPTQTVQDYSFQVLDLQGALENFIVKAQAYENAKFSTLKAAQTKEIMDAYFSAAKAFINVSQNIQALQRQKVSPQLKSGSPATPCNPVDFIADATSGISPALVKNIADLISETKDAYDAIEAKLNKGEIDLNTYNAAYEKLKQTRTLKAFHTGIGAVLKTGDAIGAGLSLDAALPAIATMTAAGVAAGTTVTWFANWYSGVKPNNGVVDQYIVSGKTFIGGKLPVHLIGQGATVTLSIQGYAPVVLSNFVLPAAGYNRKIAITPVRLSDARVGGTSDVCMIDESMVSGSCDEVAFVMGSPTPVKPLPGQGITVTGTLIPKAANCTISFSVTGTDGYADSATKTTNSAGQATFHIPGGATGVFDKVTITSNNGKSYVVSYTF